MDITADVMQSLLTAHWRRTVCCWTYHFRSDPVESRRVTSTTPPLDVAVLRGHSDASEGVASRPYVHQRSRTAFLWFWSGDEAPEPTTPVAVKKIRRTRHGHRRELLPSLLRSWHCWFSRCLLLTFPLPYILVTVWKLVKIWHSHK